MTIKEGMSPKRRLTQQDNTTTLRQVADVNRAAGKVQRAIITLYLTEHTDISDRMLLNYVDIVGDRNRRFMISNQVTLSFPRALRVSSIRLWVLTIAILITSSCAEQRRSVVGKWESAEIKTLTLNFRENGLVYASDERIAKRTKLYWQEHEVKDLSDLRELSAARGVEVEGDALFLVTTNKNPESMKFALCFSHGDLVDLLSGKTFFRR